MRVTFEPVPKSLDANRETYEVLDPVVPLRAIEWENDGTIHAMYHGTHQGIANLYPWIDVPSPHDLAVALRDSGKSWEDYRG